jgi:hypothetical protein
MERIATRDTWKNFDIVSPKKIELKIQFSEEEFELIKKGLIPKEMEDKWFIFYEDGYLYFHRSWTGRGIFKAEIIKEDNGYIIKEFSAEADKKISKMNDEKNIRTFVMLISMGLLKIPYNDLDNRIKGINSYENNEKGALEMWSTFGRMPFKKE